MHKTISLTLWEHLWGPLEELGHVELQGGQGFVKELENTNHVVVPHRLKQTDKSKVSKDTILIVSINHVETRGLVPLYTLNACHTFIKCSSLPPLPRRALP